LFVVGNILKENLQLSCFFEIQFVRRLAEKSDLLKNKDHALGEKGRTLARKFT
jgi:hypothetical protein